MRFFVCGSSALEALRSIPPQADALKRLEEAIPVGELTAQSRTLRTLALDTHGIRMRPLHLLVGRDEPTGRSPGVRTHRTSLGAIPPGLALELDPTVVGSSGAQVLIAGPELVFAQMGRLISPVAEVVLAYELCGRYSQFSQLVSGFYDRPALTSADAIGRALDALAGMRRLGRARSALQWVADGARSPMETVLACELSLPAELGGLGFHVPRLNCPVELDEAAARIAGCSVCYVDLAWPDARRGLEYNGAAFHQDPARDQRRREALAHMGWALNVVDLDHMRDHDRLMALVSLVGDELPRQPGGAAPPDEVAGLHRRLLKATRYGMGLEDAFFGVKPPKGSVQMHL